MVVIYHFVCYSVSVAASFLIRWSTLKSSCSSFSHSSIWHHRSFWHHSIIKLFISSISMLPTCFHHIILVIHIIILKTIHYLNIMLRLNLKVSIVLLILHVLILVFKHSLILILCFFHCFLRHYFLSSIYIIWVIIVILISCRLCGHTETSTITHFVFLCFFLVNKFNINVNKIFNLFFLSYWIS